MQLVSSMFEHNGFIPSKYTCDGDGRNPPLEFLDVPNETKSLALLMEDPDVPSTIREDGMWDHWIVYNIPRITRIIKEGEEPNGQQGVGTSGKQGYHRPCPPDREHRYYFYLYALDTLLDLPDGATKQEVKNAIQGHILDEAVLMGQYERKIEGK